MRKVSLLSTEEGKQRRKELLLTGPTNLQEAKSLQPPLASSMHLKGSEFNFNVSSNIFKLSSKRKRDLLPVDGLTEIAVSLVTKVTGAVDSRSRLVAVCILVTATVIF